MHSPTRQATSKGAGFWRDRWSNAGRAQRGEREGSTGAADHLGFEEMETRTLTEASPREHEEGRPFRHLRERTGGDRCVYPGAGHEGPRLRRLRLRGRRLEKFQWEHPNCFK